jgi:hypothetical protein
VNQKQIVTIASRVLSFYLIVWALDALTLVPGDAFSLSHYKALANGGQAYLYHYYAIQLCRHIAVSTVMFLGAIWTYKCGPFMESFLSPEDN